MAVDLISERVPVEEIAADAADVDRSGDFPARALRSLREAGLLGIAVPEAFGGRGASLGEIADVVEKVAGACCSTGMVYAMHVCATATIAAGARADEPGPLADALRAIAAGTHLTTLAFSERGTRSHFWAQASRAVASDGGVLIDTDKTWVTAARHADSYVVATGAVGGTTPLETELYLVAADAAGIEVGAPFDGLGLRGNDSSAIRFTGVRVSADRRIGDAMGGLPLMLSQTLPAFTTACAGCCLGLAESALAHAAAHVSTARFEHLGDAALRDLPTIRQRLGVARVRVMETRGLLATTIGQVEAGDPTATLAVLGLKASGAEMAIAVTDEAMRVCGGAAYSRQLLLERCFRDARASAVMAPTSDVVREFLGRATTGLDLL
jgi:alkylation response protein AidB-like acyl-CoA dehydrogenase